MSVQFGRWNTDGRPVDRNYFERARAILAPYGPDDHGSYRNGHIGILYHAFHITRESRREMQPHVSQSGAVLTWDGRLDNREELVNELRQGLTTSSVDVSIVAAAYDKWGTRCFGKLVGDWAVSIWNPTDESLILAKDVIGTRHLYYSVEKNQVTWATIVDPLVLLAGKSFELQEEYIAGWLGGFPATHLTPYVGVHSVPPSCSAIIRAGVCSVSTYWDFDPGKRIRYSSDAEYEEHFRAVFSEAVRRRLRSDNPVLAELSGGMDSSSIVCMADTIIARGAAETARLDTVSYYNDSEPNWNERPYFAKVEEQRGRIGCHIDVDLPDSFHFEFSADCFAATPGSCAVLKTVSKQLDACMTARGSRVLLSGIGGDEVLGGVPTPVPELEDLLATTKFMALANKLKAWALNKRKPWFHLLFEAARGFFPPALVDIREHNRPAAWLCPGFLERYQLALSGYQTRLKLFGPLPSFQENISTLAVLRRQLACLSQSSELLAERRYPYLDRDLLEFLYAAPREQLVRPGQRRSLMRRALAGIVPRELLDRKQKAYVARSSIAAISTAWTSLVGTSQHMLASYRGILDANLFTEAVAMAQHGQNISLVTLIRALALEFWLRIIAERKLLTSA